MSKKDSTGKRRNKTRARGTPPADATRVTAKMRAMVKKAIMEAVDEMAADHGRYFDAFIATWEIATENVDNMAESYLASTNVEFHTDHVDAVLRPYSANTLMLFIRLVGRIEGDELAFFRTTLEQNTNTWNKLCGIVLTRMPEAATLLGEIMERVCAANDAYLRLYEKGTPNLLPENTSAIVDGIRARLEAIRKGDLS